MNPLDALNPQPTPELEADLLEVIEHGSSSLRGLRLAPERRAAVEAALIATPALGDLAKSMRRDRATLRSLGDVRAPADLLERVEAVLERDALVGETNDHATPSFSTTTAETIPVSKFQPARPSKFADALRVVAGSRWARASAIAAGVALAGLGVWAAAWTSWHGLSSALRSGGPGSTVASGTDLAAGLASDLASSAGAAGDADRSSARAIVGKDPTAAAVASRQIARPAIVSPSTEPDAPAVATIDFAGTSPDDAIARRVARVQTARALAAARIRELLESPDAQSAFDQGRLLLIVRTPDAGATRTRLDALASAAATAPAGANAALAPSVRLAKLGASEATAAIDLARAIAPDLGTGSDPAFLASGTPVASNAAAPAPSAPQSTSARFGTSAFGASITPSVESLVELASAVLGDVGDASGVVVEILPAGAANVRGAHDTRDLASLLWWSGPSARWGARVNVPIVIETVRAPSAP
jgi:hypothetical protein